MSRFRELGTKRGSALLSLAAASVCLAPLAANAATPACTALAAALLANSDIIAATSVITPAAGINAAYCHVNITVSDLAGPKDGYQPGQKQMINVGIGLPLSSIDGGSGGVQGAWNGRTENLGGGGYAGSVGGTTSATNAGYVGSSTDTGHPASAGGTFALNPDATLNWGLIRDFAYNGIHAQAVWTKKLTQMYYGMLPKFTYWNGCSTGGRQGHQQAQKYPNDFDGILAGAPAFNWDRFIPSEQWGEIAMNQEVGAPISTAKLNAVRAAAAQACDAADGIADGIIQDPRACTYSATQFTCSVSSDPNCLTDQEAQAVNKIWDGPPGKQAGQQLWFGLERGTNFGGLDGTSPFSISTQWFQYWVFRDPGFDWHTLTEQNFAGAFKDSELMFHDVIGTDNPDLSDFKKHGGKMIMYHGLNDFLIFPRGSYNYYNRVSQLQGGVKETQKFYRFFPFPSNTHCAADVADFPNAPQINGTDLFNALVNWVEHGVAPGDTSTTLIGYNNQNHASATVSRPICKYPDTLVFSNPGGSGGANNAANFSCQVNTSDELINAEKVLPDPGASAGGDHGNGHDKDRG
ncbi:MAG: tannase/feruloyl esterase family alpha/beta hydrolase [Rhodomicrobium sp.]